MKSWLVTRVFINLQILCPCEWWDLNITQMHACIIFTRLWLLQDAETLATRQEATPISYWFLRKNGTETNGYHVAFCRATSRILFVPVIMVSTLAFLQPLTYSIVFVLFIRPFHTVDEFIVYYQAYLRLLGQLSNLSRLFSFKTSKKCGKGCYLIGSVKW